MALRIATFASALALAFGSLAGAGAARAIDFIIEPETFYVAHADEAGSYSGECADPDYETNGTWQNGGGVGAYSSDNDAIQDAIDGADEIDTVYICAGTYLFGVEGELTKDEDVTLVGEGIGVTVLDGNHHSRVINTGGDPNTLRISALTIQHADVGDYEYRNGGALLVESLIANEISITDSLGAYNGGAIYAEGEYVSIANSLVVGNSNEEDGAGIYAWNEEGSLYIDRSTFADNDAGFTGGGVGGAISASGNIYVDESEFVSNEADFLGGAIFVGGDFSITASTFSENGTMEGGAVYGWGVGAHGEITGSTFEANSALVGGAVIGYDLATLTIERSIFRENLADDFGGALRILRVGDLEIHRSSFFGNVANGGLYASNGNGGAADLCDVSNFTLTSSIFADNVSTRDGGAIGHFGGGCNGDIEATIRGNVFRNNEAASQGGALWLYGQIHELSQNRFIGNEAGDAGGAVYGGFRVADFDRMSVRSMVGNRFIGNRSGGAGGALVIPGQVETMSRNTFRSNHAGGWGGAIYATDVDWDSWAGARRNRFVRNVSETRGSAILMVCSTLDRREMARLTLRNRFSHNQADAVRRDGPIVQLDLC
jgi:predicted outer membrane repeat protein